MFRRFLTCCVLVAFSLPVTTGVAYASGAGFTLSATGVELGKPDDENAEIPRYRAKVQLGQTMTLAAQGLVMPRGAAAQPGEPDAAAWLFDDEAFQLTPHDKAKADKTKAVVALKAMKVGQTRVRFVGNILGREQKIDILIDVVEAKK
jgi:hypothetical protein